jgi:hypothetical protein
MRQWFAVQSRLAFAAITFALCGLPAIAQTVVQDIGGAQVLFSGPADPRATLILFVGSYGIVEFDANGVIGFEAANFLVRSQKLWLSQGFAIAIPGSPNGRTLNGHRQDPTYIDAIARTIDFARSRASAPVWLVGTSMGRSARRAAPPICRAGSPAWR